MKSLKNDESGVSYLLIQMALIIVVVGIVYSIVMDFTQTMTVATSYIGTPLENVMDSDSRIGADTLFTLLSYILMPILLVLIYWEIVMSQRPQKDW
jgi:hypothetical protein